MIIPWETQIIVDESLTEAGEPLTVNRTWKERLFTLPWNPLRKTKTVIPQVPSTQIYGMPDGKWVMHPEMFRRLEVEIEAKKRSN
jgi:hypothetical protein